MVERSVASKSVAAINHYALLRGVPLTRIHAQQECGEVYLLREERDCESVYIYNLHGSRILYVKEFCLET